MKLSAQHCKNLPKGSPALSVKAARSLLKDVPGWKLSSKQIQRKFIFASYEAGLGFVNAVAWIAQREDHHPEILLGYKEVTLRFSTHSVRGLSRNDFICAAKADALLA